MKNRTIGRFDHGKRAAIASTKRNLEFVLKYPGWIKLLDKTGRMKSDAEDLLKKIAAGDELPEWAHSMAQRMYDQVSAKAMGLAKMPIRIDRKRRGLRY